MASVLRRGIVNVKERGLSMDLRNRLREETKESHQLLDGVVGKLGAGFSSCRVLEIEVRSVFHRK